MACRVLSVGQLAGGPVDRPEDVLVDRLAQGDEGAGLPVELPEDAVLAYREEPLFVVGIDQHALIHDVEVERLARRMLEVPLNPSGGRVQRQRRVGVQRVLSRRHAAARRHPRLRLRRADVEKTEVRVVAARDPGVAARAQIRWRITP